MICLHTKCSILNIMKDKSPLHNHTDTSINIDDLFLKISNNLKIKYCLPYTLRITQANESWNVEMLGGSFFTIDGETINLY